MGTVNLREAFVADFDSLPKWLWSERCIYKITNILNNHAYIGQATVLIGRLRVNGGWSHLGSLISSSRNKYYHSHLYNAIRKYKSRNFIVEVLEANIDNLDEREVYWIDYYNTFEGPGYNMNRGGEDKSHLYTPEVNQRRNENGMKTCYERYGRLPIHSEESLKHSLETRALQGNGDTMWMCHTPELNARSHTPEVNARRVETDKANHGGVMGMHMEEYKELRIASRSVSHVIELVNNLKSVGKELTPYNYLHPVEGCSYALHIKRTIPLLPKMREFSEWTEELDELFSHFELIDNKILIK